ncbi:MAG: FAD-dependent monooxygenase [Leptothrix sp. (in: b-proteobacteria)]
MNAHDARPLSDLPEPGALPSLRSSPLRLAIVGAGPVGLVLALQARRRLPTALITLYDALPADRDVSADARTLALSQGSVQDLSRLGLWTQIAPHAAPIRAVHVSQQQPALLDLLPLPGRWFGRRAEPMNGAGPVTGPGADAEPAVTIRAADQGLDQLGAVLRYGALVAPLRAAWLTACAAEPQRLAARWGQKVAAVVPQSNGVEIDAGVTESHDLAVIAEGGVFADQARKGVRHDYRQTAWVGTVTVADAEEGVAYERFTPQGPAALLPLPPLHGQARAALVWCVASDDDPVRELDDAQRLAVLQHVLPARVGRLTGISALKAFPLGLNAETSLVRGRTVRIGNAAQTLHPVAGQGLNLGLRDAQALLDALLAQPDLQRAGALDQALARVAWQRAPDRWALIAATDFLARSFTWPLPGLSTLRGVALATVDALPGLKGVLARRMMFGAR